VVETGLFFQTLAVQEVQPLVQLLREAVEVLEPLEQQVFWVKAAAAAVAIALAAQAEALLAALA
jgi:hypothetical protein